jgi:hypothetical protein
MMPTEFLIARFPDGSVRHEIDNRLVSEEIFWLRMIHSSVVKLHAKIDQLSEQIKAHS